MNENGEENRRSTFFVDVLLPLPIPNMFTYRIPHKVNDQIDIGMRVLVQFGRSKILTAIISKIHQNPPKVYEAKYILELLDEGSVISPFHLDFFKWISDYYMCTQGEVLNIALPSGLKLSSESKVLLSPNFDPDILTDNIRFSDNEIALIGFLQQEPLSFKEATKLLKIKSVYPVIKSLIRKELITISEEVKGRYQPKTIKKVKLNPRYLAHDSLNTLLSALNKKVKQQEILMHYLKHVTILQTPEINEGGLDKAHFFENTNLSKSSLNTLLKNEIFQPFEIVVSRFDNVLADQDYKLELTTNQQKTSDDIMALFQSKSTVLLHGVTGSGKTEIYIDMIMKVLEGGTQVLYLLPEIALTTQIVSRLRKVFGDKLGVYHSKFTAYERVEVWKKVLAGEYQLVIGVRSSIFLPFDNLALIIVDEEHDPSYKQVDPAPRYNARDMAIVLANLHSAKVLLGSATPAIESYYNALRGKYGFVELKERYENAQLPTIKLVDMKLQYKRNKVKQSFSSDLFEAIQQNMERKEQVILFKNRRGFSPYTNCEDCAWIPQCTNCNVSLTYHQYANELRCHYCGHKENLHKVCGACGSNSMVTVGSGTEKLEEEVSILIPEAKVMRMDLETTRKKDSYLNIIKDFEEGKVDILVGTQMVSKGLDFDRVSLVGIFGADGLLAFPDFRATERTFQLITQVSGRAGRRQIQGNVLIQVFNPKHPVMKFILDNDYIALYNAEVTERQKYTYPPFGKLIKLILKHQNPNLTKEAANKLASLLRSRLGKRILGPEAPSIDRIRNKYIRHILIKIEILKPSQLKKLKLIVQEVITQIKTDKKYKSVQINIDVDPY